jgi:tetratricopeptide (TPR) repeat protein
VNLQELFKLGVQHQLAGRLAEAEALYRQILAGNPNQPEALYMLGVIAKQVGQREAAMQLVAQAIKVGPVRAEYQGTYGELLEQCERYDEAAEAYRCALALNNELFEIHNNLGNILARKGEDEKAIEHFTLAMEKRPELAAVPFNLARSYLSLGKTKEAIEFFRKAISLQPDFLDAMQNLGCALLMGEGISEAIAQFRKALAVADAMPAAERMLPAYAQSVGRILNSLGDVLATDGQYGRAIPFYDRAAILAPDQLKTPSNYCVCLLQMKRYEEAVAVCDIQLRTSPDLPQLHYSRGGALGHLGRTNEGKAALLRALALTPAPEEQIRVAQAMQITGLFDEAIEGYRTVVAKGTSALDQSAYWGMRETSLAKARRSVATTGQGEEGPAKIPYLGDKVVLLHCDRAVREKLRAAGLHGGYAIDAGDGTEIWMSAQLAAQPDAGKLPGLVEQWLEWIRNEAAMAGTTCTVWMPQMPQAVADAVRRAAGEDLIEITGSSAEEIGAKLAARAVAPPDTDDKFFAVVSIRNGGMELLPHWLEHYTNLGADELLLGIFDDLTGDSMAEIDKCAQRWKFRRFVQHWGGATESETYCQRQSGCRRAGARPGTWILHTDLDEFQQYLQPIKEVAADAAKKNIKAVVGRFVDRVAADGSLPAIQPHPSLFEQFPVECNMTESILKGSPLKVMMARFSVIVNSGHHDAPQERANAAPVGKVAHFKWHGGLLERMRWGLRQENASMEWKGDTRRFLAWLDQHGGRINLSDPELVHLH